MKTNEEESPKKASVPFDCPFHHDAVLAHSHGSMFVLSCGCVYKLTDAPPYLAWKANASSKAKNRDEYEEQLRKSYSLFVDLMRGVWPGKKDET